jgi:hypothetical protein
VREWQVGHVRWIDGCTALDLALHHALQVLYDS